HALLALFLLLEELALAGNVAAIALGEHVLAKRADRLARDDASADRRLDRDLEHVRRDEFLQPLPPRPPPPPPLAWVDQDPERIDRLAIPQDLHLDEIARPVVGELVIERSIAARYRFQAVVEVEDALVERQVVDQHRGVADIGEVDLDAPPLLAEL